MKCPYRKQVITTHSYDRSQETRVEDYMDCYGIECPFYEYSITTATSPNGADIAKYECKTCKRAAKDGIGVTTF